MGDFNGHNLLWGNKSINWMGMTYYLRKVNVLLTMTLILIYIQDVGRIQP
jgi:GH35 family endo-1,4-beta-xylanase